MLMIWNELGPPAVEWEAIWHECQYPPNITFVIKLQIKRLIDGIKYLTDDCCFQE